MTLPDGTQMLEDTSPPHPRRQAQPRRLTGDRSRNLSALEDYRKLRRFAGVSGVLISIRTLPQRLKPHWWEGTYGTDESVPFQSRVKLGRHPGVSGAGGLSLLEDADGRSGPVQPWPATLISLEGFIIATFM